MEITKVDEEFLQNNKKQIGIEYIRVHKKIEHEEAVKIYESWRSAFVRNVLPVPFERQVPIPGKRVKISDEKKNRIIALRRSGKSIEDIEDIEGINRGKLYKMLRGIYPDSWNGDYKRRGMNGNNRNNK